MNDAVSLDPLQLMRAHVAFITVNLERTSTDSSLLVRPWVCHDGIRIAVIDAGGCPSELLQDRVDSTCSRVTKPQGPESSSRSSARFRKAQSRPQAVLPHALQLQAPRCVRVTGFRLRVRARLRLNPATTGPW
jgi:hypothetical protein